MTDKADDNVTSVQVKDYGSLERGENEEKINLVAVDNDAFVPPVNERKREEGRRRREKEFVQKHFESYRNRGTLRFIDDKSLTSKFLRFSKTEPSTVFELMTHHWRVPPPTLLISIRGGSSAFEMNEASKKNFLESLQEIASTKGVWITTNGLDQGMTRVVGQANHRTSNVCVGIVPERFIRNRYMLVGGKDMTSECLYFGGSFLSNRQGDEYYEKGVSLEKNHTHFLIADSGVDGWKDDYNLARTFRSAFETFLTNRAKKIPSLLILLNGGGTAIQDARDHALNKTPVLLISGTGRAADVLVYAIGKSQEILNSEGKHSGLQEEMKKQFKFADDELNEDDSLYNMIVECCMVKDCFHVALDYKKSGIPYAKDILKALTKCEIIDSDYEQLKFALQWDRIDIARSLLSGKSHWKEQVDGDCDDELNNLFKMALANNRVDFVKLLIEYGVSLTSLLTKEVLEILYGTNSDLLHYLAGELGIDLKKSAVTDLSPEERSLYSFSTMADSGESTTSGDIFKVDYSKIKEVLGVLVKEVEFDALELPGVYLKPSHPSSIRNEFIEPYDQLFLWAVLNNYDKMAEFLWEFVSEPLNLPLIAATITKEMINVISVSSDRPRRDVEEPYLAKSLTMYKNLSSELLEVCYSTKEDETRTLLIRYRDLFDYKSTIDFAFATQQDEIVNHRATQAFLDSEWLGSVDSKVSHIRLLATIFLPFLLCIGTDNALEKKPRCGTQCSTFCEKFKKFHLESPLIRFFQHSVGEVLFLILFSYVVFSKNSPFEWSEILLIITVVGYAGQEIKELHLVGKRYFYNLWNRLDLVCTGFFIIAVVLRCCANTVAQLLYAVDLGLWILRLIRVLYCYQSSGVILILVGKMIRNFFGFLFILAVFAISFGVTMSAILGIGVDYGAEPQMVKQSIYQPYFHLLGELFLGDSDANTTMFGTPRRNSFAEPIGLTYLGVYMLIGNILLLNFLVSIFGDTYNNEKPVAIREWKFSRYQFIKEYGQQRTVLCPPFNLIELLGTLFCLLCCRCCCKSIADVFLSLGNSFPKSKPKPSVHLMTSRNEVLRRRKNREAEVEQK